MSMLRGEEVESVACEASHADMWESVLQGDLPCQLLREGRERGL